jgi:hypothetical protein
MALADEVRQRARATWAASDWDGFSLLVAPLGVDAHIAEIFGAAGVTPSIARETVDFDFPSVENAVHHYADDFGPFVMARGVLEPQGRWHEFLTAFSELVTRFNAADDSRATIRSGYLVITVER